MKALIEGKERNLPDFLIVGAAKSGTTSLYHYLKQHPQIFMPSLKEPNYFSQIPKNRDFVTDWNEYVQLFKSAKINETIGEASTSYLFCYKRTIPAIKERLGNPKIIIILRNPIERAFSHYLFYIKLGIEKNSFDKVLTLNYIVENGPWKIKINPYLELGFYYEQVKAYKDNFENVRVHLYDDFKLKQLELIKDVYLFLELDANFSPSLEIRNVSGIPKNKLTGAILSNPWISKTLISKIPYSIKTRLRNVLLEKQSIPDGSKETLKEIYKNDIEKVSALINEDLSFWVK